MGHAHESNKKRIWIVLAILTMLTTVEVILGIIKPDSLHLNGVGTSWLNWIFIILTLVKAYYIAWAFMHLEGEKTWFRRSIVWTAVFLVSYLLFIILIEGNYLHETLAPLVKW
ncbi:cytochrome C oxidase subunit IV family protein [Tenacibaculum dicentrarchi]|uniref:Cytochrome C oxidase subunit IV n=2 Tax=Tenacibaculum TaxID=104267 RepID=A0A2I2M9B0_9FLAO|nr:cytochrome C oxidase subunit IV family protein [Tenacibaculum finnmarkense]ALU75810.1 cytochrome C oxidase subunit IV [Tenacibaculum dicentrarchi]MBE7696398.1 cytochrome C oxidase subunit IV [Tenacibaculum finnmarkense genomovar ulcerans]MCD8404378.1 cytochrome C oxidase subunit IV family protein [Tenacibaculum dicentrarchi]MCD8406829.1 cytochrome C oxidase subunit IV family protein [Tenacibaculum dicentrarchi]MCD8424185.1 cytochrome C oxidase subunit IV family protein [Tenacibaculum dicent